MEGFRRLKVWEKSHSLVTEIYKITKDFPPEEKFGLVSQMRRSAISAPANIAEGSKRLSLKDRRYFYIIAESSLEELKYYLILSFSLKYISAEKGRSIMKLAQETGRMLNGLIKSLRL